MKQTGCDRLVSFEEFVLARHADELNTILLNDDKICAANETAEVISGTEAIKRSFYWTTNGISIEGKFVYSANLRTDDPMYEIHKKCLIRFTGIFDYDDVDLEFWPVNGYQDDFDASEKVVLDSYLVPMKKAWDSISDASNILRRYCPNELRENRVVNPEKLAEAMQLKVMRMPLYNMSGKMSLLITDSIMLPVSDPKASVGYRFVEVAERTIVINTSIPRFNLSESSSIAHECFHYKMHSIFSNFQRIAKLNCPELTHGEITKQQITSIDFLEEQANIGSKFLRYPAEIAEYDLHKALNSRDWGNAHPGAKYDAIIRETALYRGLPISLVKSVYSMSGHAEAKGACNHVNGRYQLPYSFDTANLKGAQSLSISLTDLIRICAKCEWLSILLTSGHLIYADGHVCVNKEEYVCHDRHEPIPTEAALRQLDLCSIKFNRRYVRHSQNGKYVYGCLGYDPKEMSRVYGLPTELPKRADILNAFIEQYKALEKLPYTFGGTLEAYRDARKMTLDELSGPTGLNASTIQRIEKRKTMNLSLETVMRLAIGLKLSEIQTADFFRKARFVVDSTPGGCAIALILKIMPSLTLSNVKDVARDYNDIVGGYDPDAVAEDKTGAEQMQEAST